MSFAQHLAAFANIPTTFYKDYPSILVHAALARLMESIDTFTYNTFPNSAVMPYIVKGLDQTLKQDYAFNLIKADNEIPESTSLSNIMGKVAY